jgi:hypothetical protein
MRVEIRLQRGVKQEIAAPKLYMRLESGEREKGSLSALYNFNFS